jgi:putative chitinase
MIGGTKGLVLSALVAAGYSKSAQANIMANVEKESNFNPRSEEIPKPEKIFSMFGPPGVKGGQPENGKNKVRFQTLKDAQDIVAAGPEAYFNKVYDGRMGNTSPGDGYKYRGRGFIQITGKDMYNRIGKMIGEDLVGNPDSANKPEIAAKIIPAFFQLKLKERKLNTEDYNDINVVNTVVGSADTKSREQRKSLAAAYANELNSGSQIDQASKENKDLKVKPNDSPAPTIINNNTSTQQTTKTTPTPQGGDDKSAYQKKVQG